MGLLIANITEKNGDTSYAGSLLINSKCIANDARADGTGSFFSYGVRSDDSVFDKYKASDALTTLDNSYASVSATFYTLAVHDDVNDSSSSTTSMPIDPADIAKGIAFPSDTTKSILWVESGGKLKKILVDKPLETIEDYIMTGTTSTTSTTTAAATTTA